MPHNPDYEQNLRLKVLGTIQPVLKQEGARARRREQIATIISGRNGRTKVSENVVRALSNAGLIQGLYATGGQLDDPGWKDIRTPRPGLSDIPTRYTDYIIRLPRTEKVPEDYSYPLRLSAKKRIWRDERNFSKWILQRE